MRFEGKKYMFMQERIEEINYRLKALKGAANVAVWGAGVHTGKLLEKTELLSYNIRTILDMDERKQGEYFFGWIVGNPRKIEWEGIDAVVISVPNREEPIVEMLRNEFGWGGIIITFYMEEKTTPFYLLYDAKIPAVRYMGDYKSWKDAAEECAGYDDSTILNKVIDSIEKVRCGEAVWERDSYLFYKEKYVYQICAAVLRCAVANRGERVKLLDIGGSLGSTWFQNRKYLADLEHLEYIVAEQDHFAEYGHKNLEDNTLKFIKSTDKWETMERFDIILMSASLQYISQYEEIISRVKKAEPRYVILDRILVSDRKRICVETVPKEIYLSSYPLVIFDMNEMKDTFGEHYKVIENDISSVPERAYFMDGMAESRFYVFECIEKK